MKKARVFKLYCGTLLAFILTALSVFLGELAKTEYKSQMTKRKLRKQLKQTELIVDNTSTNTQIDIKYI